MSAALAYSTEDAPRLLGGMAGTLARIKRRAGVDSLTFLHGDGRIFWSPKIARLGTARVGSDRSGEQLWETFHTPFGESLISPAANDNQADYTGHIRDSGSGLTYMQARYQDPVIGRFMSIDPVTFMDTGNPAHFGRYIYGNNDPVNRIDPDGRKSYLVSCPLSGPVGVFASHMFVIVVDDNTGELRGRGSYGPQGPGLSGKLVNLTGTDTKTDRDDATFATVFLANKKLARLIGVSATTIDASDDTVLKAIGDLNEFLGTPSNPSQGAPDYNILPGGNIDQANSNSAAGWVDNTATSRDGNGTRITNKPRGANNPGLRDRGNI